MSRVLYTLVTVLCALSLTPSARAQEPPGPPCGKHDEFTADLATKYHEALATVGIETRGAIVELWASADGATWTMLVTGPSGRTCMVAAGIKWETVEPQGTAL